MNRTVSRTMNRIVNYSMARKALSMIIMSFVLNACGTKGLLYLPERQYPLPTETPTEKAPSETNKQ